MMISESSFFILAFLKKQSVFRINIRKVIQIGIMPIINTANAHKDAGIGMIGAGMTNPPVKVFKKALLALNENINE